MRGERVGIGIGVCARDGRERGARDGVSIGPVEDEEEDKDDGIEGV